MDSVSLSTKGQLVLPKPVRDALRLKPGQRLRVAVEGSRIIIEPEPERDTQAGAWAPLNPAGNRLSNSALCAPVVEAGDNPARSSQRHAAGRR